MQACNVTYLISVCVCVHVSPLIRDASLIFTPRDSGDMKRDYLRLTRFLKSFSDLIIG